MTTTTTANPASEGQSLPAQSLMVLPAHSFCAVHGVAEGDAISFADDLVLDDIYNLAEDVEKMQLSVVHDDCGSAFRVTAGSQIGSVQNAVHLDSCLTLMAPDGTTQEALILVEVEDAMAAGVYLLPLGKLVAETDYRLVGIDRHAATTRLAQLACVSFTRGTRITMASGEQRPIEELRIGDKVLTRNDGPQEVRWIGQTTLRAAGAQSPVTIRKGALHNANDLVVSPDHRLFIYQRKDTVGAGRAEVLVKARHLINDDTVVQIEGGFVDYFQLVFDDHQIIYAEGIAAESLLIDPRTKAALPDDIAGNRHTPQAHHGYEITETLLSQTDAVDLLRRATLSD